MKYDIAFCSLVYDWLTDDSYYSPYFMNFLSSTCRVEIRISSLLVRCICFNQLSYAHFGLYCLNFGHFFYA